MTLIYKCRICSVEFEREITVSEPSIEILNLPIWQRDTHECEPMQRTGIPGSGHLTTATGIADLIGGY